MPNISALCIDFLFVNVVLYIYQTWYLRSTLHSTKQLSHKYTLREKMEAIFFFLELMLSLEPQTHIKEFTI